MMNFIVDRIENDIAICEDNDFNNIEIHINKIKGKVKEGDVIVKQGKDNYKVDLDKTIERKKYIEDLTKGMWN